MKLSLKELLSLVDGCLLSGDAATEVTGFDGLRQAIPGDLSFFHDQRYAAELSATRAAAVLVPKDWTGFPDGVACIGVEDPSRRFEEIVDTYGVQPEPFCAGIHSTAVLGSKVTCNPANVSIGPHAVVEDGAVIEDGVTIGAGCFVGRDARIGAGSKLFAHVAVHTGCVLGERVFLHSGVVIGADGFGYEFENGRHRKVRQSGIVQIDNDVEIGAGTMVDRARFGRTWIGEGTKIDNLVQIGHNVVIGKHCILVACVAIAGSAQIGDYVVIAAQAGVAGHVKVGSGTTLGGRCGVTKDVAPGQNYLGFPAGPAQEERKRQVGIRRLPQLTARVKALEERVGKA